MALSREEKGDNSYEKPRCSLQSDTMTGYGGGYRRRTPHKRSGTGSNCSINVPTYRM